MSAMPPEGPMPHQPKPQPIKPENGKGVKPMSTENAAILNSPFAKMFERFGAVPTAQQIAKMMANMIQEQLSQIKKDEKRAKKALRRFREDNG